MPRRPDGTAIKPGGYGVDVDWVALGFARR